MLMIYRLCANDILSNTCLGVTSCFYITFLLQITDSLLKKQQRIRTAWRNTYIGTCWVVSLMFFYPDHYGRPPKSDYMQKVKVKVKESALLGDLVLKK